MDFIRTNGKIRSPIDLEDDKKKQEELLLSQNHNILTKKDLTGKKKETHIFNFIHSVARSLNLTRGERNSLQTLVTDGFLLGLFNNDSAVMQGHCIVDLTGLYFDDDTRTFSIDRSKSRKPSNIKIDNYESSDKYLDPVTKLRTSSKKVSIRDSWDKYVKVHKTTSQNVSFDPPSTIHPLSTNYYPETPGTPSLEFVPQASTESLTIPIFLPKTVAVPTHQLVSIPQPVPVPISHVETVEIISFSPPSISSVPVPKAVISTLPITQAFGSVPVPQSFSNVRTT